MTIEVRNTNNEIIKHCNECLAYYTGNHTCYGLMKELVKFKKDKDNKLKAETNQR